MHYTVRATAWVDDGTNLVRLTNAVPYDRTGQGGEGQIDYYMFEVSTNAVRAQFEVIDPSEDVDLIVSKGTPLPTLSDFDYQSTNATLRSELVSVFNSSTPVALTPGVWFMGVVHRTTNVTTYTAMAMEFSEPGTNVLISSWQPTDTFLNLTWTNLLPGVNYYLQGQTNLGPSNWVAVSPTIRATSTGTNYAVELPTGLRFFRIAEGLSPLLPVAEPVVDNVPVTATLGANEVNYYRFRVSPNAFQANFEILPYPSGNVDMFVSSRKALPGPGAYAYASTNSGTNAEYVAVIGASLPEPLREGYWYIGVHNRSTNEVTYMFRAAEYSTNSLVRLSNGVVYRRTNAAPNWSTDYFVYSVGATAVRAQFELLNLNGNFDLVASRQLPLPALNRFDYRSAGNGTAEELITVLDNSQPVSLTPGDWYLGVVPRETSATSYEVVARESAQLGTNLLITSISIGSNTMTLTWTNMVPGVNYHLEGAFGIGTTNWADICPTIRATSSGGSYTYEWPSGSRFFRVVEGLSTMGVSAGVRVNITMGASNRYELSWKAAANRSYEVQWSPAVRPAAWQAFTNMVTSTDGNFRFTDDGSQGSGGGRRFYRVMQR